MMIEDRQDAEIGLQRVAEIESGAASLVSGVALKQRLKALLN
jgi:hypothetical protein